MAPTSSSSSTYYSSTSTSYSSSTSNGQTTSYAQHTTSDPSGTRVHQVTQEPGQAAREERFEIDNSGRRIGDSSSAGRIEDVTDAEQQERDREYEERMEDEYAKREGGA